MLVFQWFRCFVGSPPFGASCWPLAGLLLASCWLPRQSTPPEQPAKASRQGIPPEHPARAQLSPGLSWPLAGFLAGLLLASSWPVAGFFLASCWLPCQSIPLENRFFKKLPKLVSSLHANACFSMVSVFRGVPPIWGLFLASCCPLAGLMLASSWLLAGFPQEHPARKSFFKKLPKLVNSLHENACFSLVSVFRGVPSIWGLFLASCWPLDGLSLASCWPLAVLFLASCRLLGFLLASSFPTRISLENRFFKRFLKLVNSLHENACFSMVWASCWLLAGLPARARRQSSPLKHPARASRPSTPPEHSWALGFPGLLLAFLLASSWPVAGFFLASCWPPCLLLASSWLLAGLFPASPPKHPARKSVFKKLPKLVNSLHENAWFSLVSEFREAPRI